MPDNASSPDLTVLGRIDPVHNAPLIAVTEAKALLACREVADRIQAAAVCKPLLKSGILRECWRTLPAAVPCIRLTPTRYRELVCQRPARGLALVLRRPRWGLSTLERIGGCWFAIRHLRSTGNLGTLIRSAHALGIRGIVLIGGTIDPYQPTVQRASMGAVWRLPMVRTGHAELAAWLAQRPAWQGIAATPDGALTPEQIDWQRPGIVVFGHERHGLTGADRSLAPIGMRIPQLPAADSLNIAMAASIIAYHAGMR